MRAVRLFLATAALLVGAAGCSSDERSETLRVVTSTWNGWDRNDKPVPETTTFEVSPGDTFQVDTVGGPAEFTVSLINDTSVDLFTTQRLAFAQPGGGIDLNDTRRRFAVTRDAPLELATPTLDAGTSITITIE